jgi:hypothetical protein
MKPNRTFATLVLSLIALVCIILLPSPAYAQGCSAATIAGSYGYRFSVLFAPPGRVTLPLKIDSFIPGAQAGRIVFTPNSSTSSDGTVTFSQKGNVGGVPSEATSTGSYSVNPDCTGTLTRDNDGTEFFFTVVQGGAEIEFAFHTSMSGQKVGEGIMKKQ